MKMMRGGMDGQTTLKQRLAGRETLSLGDQAGKVEKLISS
jgi:hypothetical protein